MDKVFKLNTYDAQGNVIPFPSKENQAVISDFKYDAGRMGGAPTLSFSVYDFTCLDNLWSYRVHAEFNGEKYFLHHIPSSSFSNADARYKHEVVLASERTKLDSVYFFDVVSDKEYAKPISNSSNVVFFGDVNEFAYRLNESLKYSGIDYTVIVDNDIISEEKQVSFSNMFITNVLQEIYKIYNIPYYFVGKEIHIGEASDVIPTVFEYGVKNQLISIQRNNNNTKIVNRCTGVGSSDNIPYYYPNQSPYGTVKVYLNGVETSGVSITDWQMFAKCGIDGELTYVVRDVFNDDIIIASDLRTFVQRDVVKMANIHAGAGAGFDLYACTFTYKHTARKYEERISATLSHKDTSLYNAIDLSIVDGYGNTVATFNPLTSKESAMITRGEYTFVVRVNVLSESSSNAWAKAINDASVQIKSNARTTILRQWELKDRGTWSLSSLGIKYALETEPINGDVITFKAMNDKIPFMPHLVPSVYRETLGVDRFFNAINDTYVNSDTGEYYEFPNEYVKGMPKEHIYEDDTIKPTIEGMLNADGEAINQFIDFAYDEDDNDEVGTDGNYLHPYFYGKLRKFNGVDGFNLFDHAIESGSMTINMTSGTCGGCAWVIGVSESQKNVVQIYTEDYTDDQGVLHKKGDLMRDIDGNVLRSIVIDEQNDTVNNEVWIALKKDISTFGTIMPSASRNYRPSAGDSFVITNIALPEAYIRAAEHKLDADVIKYMSQNNVEGFSFSIKFSRIYLEENPSVAALITENSRLKVKYNNIENTLYVTSFSCKCSNGDALPEITVELSDTLKVGSTNLQTAVTELKEEVTIISKNTDVAAVGEKHFVGKTSNEYVGGVKTFTNKMKCSDGVSSSNFIKGEISGTGWGIYEDLDGKTVVEVDKVVARRIINTNDTSSRQIDVQRGDRVLTAAACKITQVEEFSDYYRCSYNNEDGSNYSGFEANDLALCRVYNGSYEESKYYWRCVLAATETYVDLSKSDVDGDGVPEVGDEIVMLGNTENAARQSALIFSPLNGGSIRVLNGIDGFSLDGKDYVGFGFNPASMKAEMYCYGDSFIGDASGNGGYIRFTLNPEGVSNLEIKANVTLGATSDISQVEQFNSVKTSVDNLTNASVFTSADLPALENEHAKVVAEYGHIISQCENYGIDYQFEPNYRQPAEAYINDLKRAITAVKNNGSTPASSVNDSRVLYYEALELVQDAISEAIDANIHNAQVNARPDLDYLKRVFPNAILDVNGASLAQLLGVKNTASNVVAGLYGGADEELNSSGFIDSTKGILMFFAGAETLQDVAMAATRIYEDGTIVAGNGKIIFNADGSGHLANGRLSWDANGVMSSYYPTKEIWQDIRLTDDGYLDFQSGAYFYGLDGSGRTIRVANNDKIDKFCLKASIMTRSSTPTTYIFDNEVTCYVLSDDEGIYSKEISGNTVTFFPTSNPSGIANFTWDETGRFWVLETSTLSVGDGTAIKDINIFD